MSLTDHELKSIVQAEIDDAIGFVGSEITDDRADAIKYYNSELFGDEVDGNSAFVSSDVSDVIETMMPSLMRIFTSSDKVVEVIPQTAEDEPFAEQAQDYLNWAFYRNNPGFMVLEDVFRDALLSKVGVFKVFWEDATEVVEQTGENLTEAQLLELADRDDVEILSQEEGPDLEQEVSPLLDDMGNQMFGEAGEMLMTAPPMLYDVKYRETTMGGKVVVQAVPPEEFLISKRATSLEDAPFMAHRVMKTTSDLIEMGYDRDVVESLPTGEDLTYSEERINRYGEGEVPDSGSNDPAMREIMVYECYIKIDIEQDGVATWRKVTISGFTILDNEPVDEVPFATICPIPIPHRFFGRSIADLVMPLQRLKSVLTRQMLDNAYMTNNSRMVVQEGQANLDDVLTNRPGGVIRVKNPTAIQPLVVQNMIGNVFPLLQYFDQVRDERTVGQGAAGLDPNILQNTTATAIAAMQQSAMSKMELVARNFAETGVKRMFYLMLKAAMEYESPGKIIRLRNEFVKIEPRGWSKLMDISINVGLGTNSQEQQMAMLGLIASKQEQILLQTGPDNPLVGVEEYRNTLRRMVELAGFKGVDEYVRPGGEEMMPQAPQPPQPSAEEQKLAADIQLERAKLEAEMALEREKAAAKLQLEKEKLEMQFELKRAELEAEIGLKNFKASTDVGEQGMNVRSVV